MKTHRFITTEPFRPGPFELQGRELVHQVVTVLKLHVGEHLILCDGKGNEAEARISSLDAKKRVALEVGPVKKNTHEPTRHVTLYAALLKRENFELVLQKATEIGVAEIVPLVSDRTIKRDFKRDRAEKIIREAVEQSGRGIIPTLYETQSVEEALADASRHDVTLFFDGDAKDSIRDLVRDAARIAVFIGPEGGWSEEEVAFAKKKKVRFSSLGSLTLRGETAAIVATFSAINA